MGQNNLKKFREEIMLSKAELARKAKVSSITIGRIEDGMPCRLETMRKIIHGLGKNLADRDEIFPDDSIE
ncbi:MAG: helix-turn-helix transcriptional regulator [Pseudomonadota bacterium]